MTTPITLRNQLAEPATTGPHEPVLCFAASDNALGVMVRADNGGTWCFPYSHFLYSDLTDDLLTVRFATHVVLVRGANLDIIVSELAAQHLALLRSLPKRQKGQIEREGVWIETLRVQPISAKDD